MLEERRGEGVVLNGLAHLFPAGVQKPISSMAWLLGSQCIAAIDTAGQLGILDASGKHLHMEVASEVGRRPQWELVP